MTCPLPTSLNLSPSTSSLVYYTSAIPAFLLLCETPRVLLPQHLCAPLCLECSSPISSHGCSSCQLCLSSHVISQGFRDHVKWGSLASCSVIYCDVINKPQIQWLKIPIIILLLLWVRHLGAAWLGSLSQCLSCRCLWLKQWKARAAGGWPDSPLSPFM